MTKEFGAALEGGGMRGMFTAGVLDTLMNINIYSSATVGVSAGAVFGCNYKSRQIGRTIRYNKAYCRDRRYASIKNWILTGSVYSKKFAYEEIPNKLDPFDAKTFSENPMRFTVVCTDMATGSAVYHDCEKGDSEDIEWMRASAAVPVASSPVVIDGKSYLDGGISDSIPFRRVMSYGYEKNIAVLTQPLGYKKGPNEFLPFLERKFKNYPEFVNTVRVRHEMYNSELSEIAELEKKGALFVIRPSEKIVTNIVERNSKRLGDIYKLGASDMESRLEALKEYLEN